MKKRYFTVLLLLLTALFRLTTITIGANQPATPSGLISRQGKMLFINGINLAWIEFGNDMDNFNAGRFNQALGQVSKAGGNAVRWWIHVNGSHSPQFNNSGYVSGLSSATIPTLKKALDMARKKNVGLILCLWSFDMLQNQGQNLDATKKLIEDKKYTQAYIQNALVPMVRAVKGHPALIAWEVCNEPEGMTTTFGWTYRRTQMRFVQQFVNLIAGAIHRQDPNALVTNGSWNLQVVGNVAGCANFYTNEVLIKAGGDELGYLDFYQIHYYPHQNDETTSPFHHPATYWNLDKPILIGEFPAKGLRDFGKGYLPKTTLTTEQAYQFAFQNGYAGVLSWTYSNHDGFGGIKDAAPGMKKVNDLASDLIRLDEMSQ